MRHPEVKAPFQEPWQAEALATAMGLQEAGVFSAAEWSDALGAAIRRAQESGDPDEGNTYYLHVLDALEVLLSAKGVIGVQEIAARKDQWVEAYRTTPHGHPVMLKS